MAVLKNVKGRGNFFLLQYFNFFLILEICVLYGVKSTFVCFGASPWITDFLISNIISSSIQVYFSFYFLKWHLDFSYFLQRVWSMLMYVMIFKFFLYVIELNFQWNILWKCCLKNAISVQIKLLQHMFEKSNLIWGLAKKKICQSKF